jgi:hypothetical protein
MAIVNIRCTYQGPAAVDKPDSDFLDDERAHAIARLSALERMRDIAREGKRDAMLRNIEEMIRSELRVIQSKREESAR